MLSHPSPKLLYSHRIFAILAERVVKISNEMLTTGTGLLIVRINISLQVSQAGFREIGNTGSRARFIHLARELGAE